MTIRVGRVSRPDEGVMELRSWRRRCGAKRTSFTSLEVEETDDALECIVGVDLLSENAANVAAKRN